MAVVLAASIAGATAARAADPPIVKGGIPAVPARPSGEGSTVMPMPLGIDPETGFSLSLGGSAWKGDFGAPTNSDVEIGFVNARYRRGDVRFNATLPWMRVRSEGTIFTGIDGTPLVVAPQLPTGRSTRRGFGDVTLGVNWLALKQDAIGADVEFSGRIKVPTATDASGLSTGKVDYAVATEVSRSFGAITPTVRVGYRFLGDPADTHLRNGASASLGASFLLFGDSVALVSYDYAERASHFVKDSHEASVGLSTPIGRRLRLNSYGTVGLSSGAADLSAGLSLSFALGR